MSSGWERESRHQRRAAQRSRHRLRCALRGVVRAVLLQVGRRDPHGGGSAGPGRLVANCRRSHCRRRVNLPSLLILARETRPTVAMTLAVGVWLLAVLAGLSESARL